MSTLKRTEFLNKAIQIVINNNNEFIVVEDIELYKAKKGKK